MFDGETLISFVDGMVTDQPDLTDTAPKHACRNPAWQMIWTGIWDKHGLTAKEPCR